MSRTLGALAAAFDGEAHSTCLLLRLDLRDGTAIGLTDHDAAIDFDLGDGEIAYSPFGIAVSDVVLAAGMETSNFEVTGPLGGAFTLAAVRGGRFTAARARLFMVDWTALDDQAAILAGRVAEPRVEGGAWVFEVRGAADALNQTIGRVLSPYCTADFGDAQCGVVRTEYPCTVTAVEAGAAGTFRFTVDLGGDHADDFFNLGEIAFQDGALAGTLPVEVFDYDGTTGAVELYAPLVQPPEVGDAATLYRGCSKLMVSDDPALPTCAGYGNGVRFRGWPDVPGSDLYLKMSPPGGGNG